MNRSETSRSSTSGSPIGAEAAVLRDRRPAGSESEYHFVFLRLEYGITDPQAGHRDRGGNGERTDLRPATGMNDIVKQVEEVESGIEAEPPVRLLRKLTGLVEDRRDEMPGLQEHRDQMPAVAVERVGRGHGQPQPEREDRVEADRHGQEEHRTRQPCPARRNKHQEESDQG